MQKRVELWVDVVIVRECIVIQYGINVQPTIKSVQKIREIFQTTFRAIERRSTGIA
jgi:hypothetical protein